jgi:F-type H+-transporting ATPase subunit b
VFVVFMVYIFRNRLRIGKVFEDRAAGIQRELEEARKEKEEAQRRLIEIESRLERVDQEAAEIRARAEIEAKQEAERIRQSAEADSEKIRQLAKREIEGAMRAARAELRSYVADLSVGLAKEGIRRDIKPEDDSKILADYVRELGEVRK